MRRQLLFSLATRVANRSGGAPLAATNVRPVCDDASARWSSSGRGGRSNEAAEAQSRGEKPLEPNAFSQTMARYGRVALGTHVVIGLTHLVSWYGVIRWGLDVPLLLEQHGGTVGAAVLERLPEGSGDFMLAYAIHKATSPVRMGVTVAVTPLVARAVGA